MSDGRSRHSEIIKALCGEILSPLGVFQKGSYRVYLDDNGYYLTVVEFQPSAWAQGSYLNVGIHFLWNTWEHISLDICTRVGDFVQYQDDGQFEREMRAMVTLARDRILYFRDPRHVRKAMRERRGDLKNRSLYLAYHGKMLSASRTYAAFLKSPDFAKIAGEMTLPGSAEALTQDLVRDRIWKKRAMLRTRPATARLPFREETDGGA